MALTGQRLKGEEVVQVGLADYYVKRENLGKLGLGPIEFLIYALSGEILQHKHRWSSGMIVAFQAADTGSIPVRCNFLIFFFFIKFKNL